MNFGEGSPSISGHNFWEFGEESPKIWVRNRRKFWEGIAVNFREGSLCILGWNPRNFRERSLGIVGKDSREF